MTIESTVMNTQQPEIIIDPNTTDGAQLVQAYTHRMVQARKVLDDLDHQMNEALKVMGHIQDTISASGQLLTCGNGGSAAQAMHFSEELIGRFRGNRAPIPAVCLNADPTAMSCIANDFGFEEVFARQVDGLARQNDTLVVFTTSGKSPNIIAALKRAKERGCSTVGMLGGDGGPALALCDYSVVIPGTDSAAIQEGHQTLIHACCEVLEHHA